MYITRFSKKFAVPAVLSFAATLTLSACSEATTETSFTNEKDGLEATLTYTHKDDEVIKQTVETVIEYEALEVEDKEEARALMGPLFEEDADVDGIEYFTRYGKTSVTH